MDFFNLYKQVLKQGGMLATERYDQGRWVGKLNFGGLVFPKMRNYTQNNRATSVGSQLINTYRKTLLNYEKAWQYVDLIDHPTYLRYKRQQLEE